MNQWKKNETLSEKTQSSTSEETERPPGKFHYC